MTKARDLSAFPNTGFAFKNRIINGAMVIDQRNAGASVTPANAAYTLDRWAANMYVNASKFTVQQNAGSVTPPAGFTNYLGVTSSSAYSISSSDIYTIYQAIEGYNVADLGFGTANAKTITVSFWVRSSLTGTFGGVVQNNANDRNYPIAFTISSANTWEYKTVTIPGDTTGTWATTSGTGIILRFGLGVGSTYSGTAGAWTSTALYSATGATSVVGTNGATFYITGVQLEVGSTATSFDYRPYGTELSLCRRYFYQVTVQTDWGNSSGYAMGFFYHPVEMRTSPTRTAISTSAGSLMGGELNSLSATQQLSGIGTGQAASLTQSFSAEL